MKVVGTPEAWQVERTCVGCRHKMRITIDDLRKFGRESVIAECSECGKIFDLSEGMPPSVVELVEKRKKR